MARLSRGVRDDRGSGTRGPSLFECPRAAFPRGASRDYVALTKPRIIELLLVTTVPTMILAADGLPGLAGRRHSWVGPRRGEANTLNCVYDRDIDRVMHRTSNRPFVTGAISPAGATVFGLTRCLAVGWLAPS